jgi:hypothetical protein
MAKRDQETEEIQEQTVEALYSKEELMAAAEVAFGTKPEVVAAALKMAGKIQATRPEADAAIKAFLKKEVK